MGASNEYYQSRFVFDSRRDAVWKEICRYLQKRYIPKQSSILELGAGYCHFVNYIEGREKHAWDLSQDIRRYADSDVTTHVGSCLSLNGIKDNQFQIVFASNLFEHLSQTELRQTLAEIRRVLQPEGKLVVIQPNFKFCFKDYFDDYTHIQVFTHIGLSDLLRASGFTIQDLKPRFLPFSMKSKFPKISWLVRLYLHSPIKPFAGQMLVVAANQTKEK